MKSIIKTYTTRDNAMKKKRKLVSIQDDKVKQSKDASYGETSPYWNDFNHQRGAEDAPEHVRANPDSLMDQQISTPSNPQFIMGEAIEHLQGRQREVYMLLMRENKTYAETSEILGIAQGAVQTYQKRAIKFIGQYCKQAIVKGRI